jgi:small multidrug resistance pump
MTWVRSCARVGPSLAGDSTEVVATSALKASEQFTKLIPSLIVIIGYCISFYLVTLVLRTIPVGITYAIWAGVGIVLVRNVSMKMRHTR